MVILIISIIAAILYLPRLVLYFYFLLFNISVLDNTSLNKPINIIINITEHTIITFSLIYNIYLQWQIYT